LPCGIWKESFDTSTCLPHAGRCQQEHAVPSFQSMPQLCSSGVGQTSIFPQNGLAFEPLNKHLLRLLNGSKKGDATYLVFGLFQSLFLQDSALTNTIARSP